MKTLEMLAVLALAPLGMVVGVCAEKAIAQSDRAQTSQTSQASQVLARIKAFEDFDYDQCNWIVSSISKAPANWKEIRQTPGGNYCVTTIPNPPRPQAS
jgi:hypothetical protein